MALNVWQYFCIGRYSNLETLIANRRFFFDSMNSKLGSRLAPVLQVCDGITPANVEDGADTALFKALVRIFVTAAGDPNFSAVEEVDMYPHTRNFVLFFTLWLFKTRLNNVPIEQFKFERLLSISLSIHGSVEIMQPRYVNCSVEFR